MSATITTETAPVEASIFTAQAVGDVANRALLSGAVPDAGRSEVDSSTQQSQQNPPGWLTNHRRIPGYRAPQYHPRWSTLTSSTMEAFMVTMMFRGCQVLEVGGSCTSPETQILMSSSQYSEWLQRRLGFDPNYFTYQIAGEW